MKILRNNSAFQKYCKSLKNKKLTIAFVPTMGCLHEGHCALMKQAKKIANISIVSIFVNPLQFGPNEDYKIYPRPIDNDIQLCKKINIDVLFLPSEKTFYSKDFSININENLVSKNFCGQYRNGHFDGVLTVVNKLLNLSMPDYIMLGQKDYQQSIVIKKLISDMNIPVKVKIGKTIREKNGLALSSRNKYLTSPEKEKASKLFKTLKLSKILFNQKKINLQNIKDYIMSQVSLIKDFKIQYIEVADSISLETDILKIKKPVILLAGFFGKTRLIDNILL